MKTNCKDTNIFAKTLDYSPPRVVAAGNPCRVIKKITDADKVGFVK